MRLRTLIKNAFARCGYDIVPNGTGVGHDSFKDMQTLLAGKCHTIFDVGANDGQSIGEFRRYFPEAVIHSFEPCKGTFEQLVSNTRGMPGLALNNTALGAREERRVLIGHDENYMNSFLEAGKDCWSNVCSREEVAVTTLDDYCDEQGVSSIDILKIDTQGYDLEVLRGGERTLEYTDFVYLEVTFCDLYRGTPPFDEIYRFLVDRQFSLVAMYNYQPFQGITGWADALFRRSPLRGDR